MSFPIVDVKHSGVFQTTPLTEERRRDDRPANGGAAAAGGSSIIKLVPIMKGISGTTIGQKVEPSKQHRGVLTAADTCSTSSTINSCRDCEEDDNNLDNDSSSICEWDRRPGTPGNLTPEHEKALTDLTDRLFGGTGTGTDGVGLAHDEHRGILKHCAAHEHEDRVRMLLRFLRGNDFNVDAAEQSLRDHSDFWNSFGIDRMSDEQDAYRDVDSPDGLYFPCGRDRFGHPVMVARPCVHVARNAADSERAARRCVYTLARCCETRLSASSDGTVVLYDCDGVRPANCDLAFSKKLVSYLDPNFPERVIVILIIRNSWAVQGLWSLISPLLDPVTKKKIVMCGHNFDAAKQWLGEDHPYLKRCEAEQHRRRRSGKRHGDDSVSSSGASVTGRQKQLQDRSSAANALSIRFSETTAAARRPRVRASEELMFVVSDPRKEDCPIIHASDAFLRCTGYTLDAVLHRNCRLLKGPKTSHETSESIRTAIAEMSSASLLLDEDGTGETKADNACGGIVATLLNYRRDGTNFWNELHVCPVRCPFWNDVRKRWQWRTRLLIGVQQDRTAALRSCRKGNTQRDSDNDDPSTWEVPASVRRLKRVRPPSFPQQGDNASTSSPAATSIRVNDVLDPAQAISLAVEQSLKDDIDAGQFDQLTADDDDDAWLLALHTRFLELRASRQRR